MHSTMANLPENLANFKALRLFFLELGALGLVLGTLNRLTLALQDVLNEGSKQQQTTSIMGT